MRMRTMRAGTWGQTADSWIWRLFWALRAETNGRLDDMEVSDKDQCLLSVEIEVDVDGVKEPWLLMFNKNP